MFKKKIWSWSIQFLLALPMVSNSDFPVFVAMILERVEGDPLYRFMNTAGTSNALLRNLNLIGYFPLTCITSYKNI